MSSKSPESRSSSVFDHGPASPQSWSLEYPSADLSPQLPLRNLAKKAQQARTLPTPPSPVLEVTEPQAAVTLLPPLKNQASLRPLTVSLFDSFDSPFSSCDQFSSTPFRKKLEQVRQTADARTDKLKVSLVLSTTGEKHAFRLRRDQLRSTAQLAGVVAKKLKERQGSGQWDVFLSFPGSDLDKIPLRCEEDPLSALFQDLVLARISSMHRIHLEARPSALQSFQW